MSTSTIGFAALALLGTALFGVLALKPRHALASGVALVLLASTKFRHRDALALLSGSLDTQVFFEIGLYALVLAITARALLLVPLASFRIGRAGTLLSGYVAVALLSALWSANLEITFVRALQLFVLFAYAFVAVTVFGAPRMLRITAVSAVLYVLAFAGMALLFPFANGTRPAAIPRFTWFAVHPIGAGVFAGTAALFLLARTLLSPGRDRPHRIERPLSWLTIGFLVWVLLATQSRGPIFAFVLAAAVLLVRKYVVGVRALLTSDRVLLGMLGTAIALLVPVVTGRRGTRILYFILRGQTPEEFLNMTGRTSLWDVAFDFLLQRPVLGHGYLAARDVLLQQVSWGGHAHNALIDSLFSLGLVGAAFLWVAFIVVLGTSFLRTFRLDPASIRDHAMVFSGTVFLLFNSVTGDSFAGIPSYEPMLLVVFVLSNDALARDPPAGVRDERVRGPQTRPRVAAMHIAGAGGRHA